MEFDSIRFGNAGELFHLTPMPSPLLTKGVIPKVKKAKTISTKLTLQSEDVFNELGRVQV